MRRSAPLLALLCAACGGLSVDAISPALVVAGASTPVTVTGQGFAEDLQLALEADGTQVTVPLTALNSETEAVFTVPAAAPAAVYDVVAAQGGATASLPGALTVTEAALTVAFVDIGQGDATIVLAPSGEVLLIDGGGLDAGPTIRGALATLTDGRVDHVIVSHHDADHLAGVVSVLAGEDGSAGTGDDLLPDTLYVPSSTDCDTQTCNRFLNLAAASRASTPMPGDRFTLGEVEVEVVASDGRVGEASAPGGLDENGRSIVVNIHYAGRSVLVLGDLTGGGLGTVDLESPLSIETGPVDVLRTGHHGSATSSVQAALSRWAPRLAVLSMGTDNAYCHPVQEVLERVATASVDVVGTGLGTVEDTERCGESTTAPINAELGRGTMLLTITADGSMLLDDQPL